MTASSAMRIRGVAGVVAALALMGIGRLANASEGDRGTEQPATGPAREVRVSDARQKARALFESGQIHYSLGEYDEAIARFREAYELTAAPALLFNIAQAHRLKGDCATALEIYRHFARLAPDSTEAAEASVRIRELAERCPSAAVRPPYVTVAPSPPALRTARTSTMAVAEPAASLLRKKDNPDARPGSTRIRIARMLLIGGATVAVAAGILYWWNDSRYARWSSEDSQLAARSGASADRSVWIARQNGNDSLLRSIHHADTAIGVLFAVSGIGILGSATLGFLPAKGPQIALAPGEIRVAWGLRWP